MLIPAFYLLNGVLLLSGLLIFRLKSGERRFSLSPLRVLVVLPLLAAEYFYLTRYLVPRAERLLFFFRNRLFLPLAFSRPAPVRRDHRQYPDVQKSSG
jgi:hypothetical protein